MKKLLLSLILGLLGTPALAAHFNCTIASACTETAPCNWATAGSWTGCNSDYPHNGVNTFTATVSSGKVVVIATDAMTVGLGTGADDAITNNGTIIFSDSATGRDAQGFRNLTLIPPTDNFVYISTGGTMRIGAGNRILVDSTTRYGRFYLDSNSRWYGEGITEDATITTIADSDTTTPTIPDPVGDTKCDGVGTDKQRHRIWLSNGADKAKVGRRIRFLSGQLRNRQYEIVAVSGQSVDFCTDLVDHATDLTCDTTVGNSCGQRLRGHVTIGQFPASAPPTNTRHWTPADTPNNDICTANVAPHPYCTGANAGTGTSIYPMIGDKVRVIDDWWIAQTGGTNGWAFMYDSGSVMPTLRAANFAGLGDSGITQDGISVSTVSGSATSTSWSDLNVHDYKGSAPIVIIGFSDYTLDGIACHDSQGAGQAAGCIVTGGTGVLAPDNVTIQNGHWYRTQGNALNFQSAACTSGQSGVRILNNLVHDGCVAADGNECRGIEVNCCNNCTIAGNVVYDISTAGATPSTKQGDCYRTGGDAGLASNAFTGTVFYDNYGVNCSGRGFNQIISNTTSHANVTMTHNYISNTGDSLGFGGRYFGNFFRNGGLLQQGSYALSSAAISKGNIILGADAAVRDGAGCANCAHTIARMWLGASDFDGLAAATHQDNVYGFIDSGGNGCIDVNGNYRGNLLFEHITCDLDGIGTIPTRLVGWAPTASTTADFNDMVYTHANNSQFAWCSTDADGLDRFGTYMRNISTITTDQVADHVASGDCTAAGTLVSPANEIGYVARKNYNWNLRAGATALTAGASPSGSPLGIRAFRFERSRLSAPWGNALPFVLSAGDPTGATITPWPANIANVSNVDTDGDGVIDLHDNCDRTFNPSQLDSNSNGVGDACGG